MILNDENRGESGSADGGASDGSITKHVGTKAGNTLRLDQLGDDLFGTAPASTESPVLSVSVRAMLRQVWLILGVFVLIAGVTIPAIWILVQPLYEAKAIIRVSPVGPRIVFRTEDNGMVPLYQSFLNTQVAIIRSPTVLQRVLDNAAIRETQWFKDPPRPLRGAPPSPMERLRADLTVSPRRGTELIDVKATLLDGAEAKLIADVVVDEFKRYSDESLSEADVVRLATLQHEKLSLERAIDGILATKGNLTTQIGMADPGKRLTQLTTQVAVLEAERGSLQRDLALTIWELNSQEAAWNGEEVQEGEATSDAAAENPDVSGGAHPILADDTPRYAGDPEWRARYREVSRARYELDMARLQYGPSHPRIASLTRKLEDTEQQQRELVAELDAEPRATTSTTFTGGGGITISNVDRRILERRIERRAQQVSLLEDDIAKQEAMRGEIGRLANAMARYDEDLRHKRETYELMRSRLEQLTLERKAPARISIATYALEPSGPSRDRRMLLTAMALCAALGGGLFAGYIRIATDPRIHEAAEVRRAAQGPFLGQLPPLPTTQDVLSGCEPYTLECVRMVRTALLERVKKGNGDGSTILVTSATTEVGKTSFAILLAQSLALLGKRTLLVEADLYRPSLQTRLDVSSELGLISILTKRCKSEDAVHHLDECGFDVLLAGQWSEGSDPELLANGGMAAAMKDWKRRYDFVLLDGPPVLPVADARILSGVADGTIMVLRSAHSRRSEVRDAYAHLGAAGGTLLGTVLVGASLDSAYQRYDYYTGGDGGSGETKLLDV